ncbi:MAG: DUF4105 domain-containing protein [Prevotellaceae bacterium]|nr:DUF4105 domain-containing protein [Prevotellaceae bacterium]
MKQRLLLFILSLCLLTVRLEAAQPIVVSHDSIRLSLLTCAAGEEIYSLFGHTAIRYENNTRGIDVVFNYGIFNYDVPYFALRFALGETDYRMGAIEYDRFIKEYAEEHRDVWQQVLNLRQDEKEQLVDALLENYRPENQLYRYNIFYNNCATRPRDRIEAAVDGSVLYADDMSTTDTDITFRSLVYRYTEQHLWSRLGIDLCLGLPADQPISRRTMMFVPFYVRDFFAQAHIVDNPDLSTAGIDTTESIDLIGMSRPLVSEEETLLSVAPLPGTWTDCFTPMRTFLLVLLLVVVMTVYGILTRRSLWGIDLFLFFVFGGVGCVIAFLVFFSHQPTVSPNYLLLVFHPLHLLLLPHLYNKVSKKKLSWYFVLVGVILTLFIALSAGIPQKINVAVLPLAACLPVRAVSNIILSYRRNGR